MNNTSTCLVIPCYNEEKRLNLDSYRQFLRSNQNINLIFVNDGSTDQTRKLLSEFCAQFNSQCKIINLKLNQGKAEAVRQGMLEAFANFYTFCGYWDADLATPFSELQYFEEKLLNNPQLQLIMGSRIKRLGAEIHRKLLRHYLGRIFATAASLVLNLGVYDTQCGAKMFRCNPANAELFSFPFETDWIFDVEILARLLKAGRHRDNLIYEIPLNQWKDVCDSKIRPSDFLSSLTDLFRIYRYLYL